MKKVRLDKAGRIVIPKPFCKELNLQTGSVLKITLENGSVLVTPDTTLCKLCSSPISTDKPFPLCSGCISKIQQHLSDDPSTE